VAAVGRTATRFRLPPNVPMPSGRGSRSRVTIQTYDSRWQPPGGTSAAAAETAEPPGHPDYMGAGDAPGAQPQRLTPAEVAAWAPTSRELSLAQFLTMHARLGALCRTGC
jgi:hypothetical protein